MNPPLHLSPTTEPTTCVQDEAPPVLDVKEPSANHQLVPVHQAASHQLSTIDHQLSSGLQPTGRVRLGKVARLPKQYREMVCRMLRNNCSARNIVDALDEFGFRVTQRNISNWKTRGGYQQWCLEQDRAAEIHLHQDNLLQYLRKEDGSQIPEVGLQLAANHISRFLLHPEALQQLIHQPDKYSRVVGTLCRVAGQLHTLQKHREDCAKSLGPEHNPELVRRENEEEIESAREHYSSTPATKPSDDNIPHRNFMPAASMSERLLHPPLTSEQLEAKKREQEISQRITESFLSLLRKQPAGQNESDAPRADS